MGRRQGGPRRTGGRRAHIKLIRNRRATQPPAHLHRNLRAAASWLLIRVARSSPIDSDMLVARALKNSQLTCGETQGI